MNQKTVVITGANSGIGKETARALAAMGAKVVMVCRDKSRGEAALKELSLESPGSFDLLQADISSLRSVEKLAIELKNKYPRIDVLLHNAGAFFDKKVESAEGIEMTLATNHIGVVHLTNLMLDHMKQSAPSRIVIVSSEAHLKAKVNLQDIELRNTSFAVLHAYAQSKLLNLMYMRELDKKISGTGVTINCVHPGVVATNIVKANTGFFLKTLGRLLMPFILTPAQGARTSIKVCTDPALEKVSNKYFEKEKIAKHNQLADDQDLTMKVWQLTEKMIADRA